MFSLLKSLKLLSDPTRVRILLLLQQEELSVAELQEILGKGQSQVSTLLAQLKAAGLVHDRRTGKNIFYSFRPPDGLPELLRKAAEEIPEAADDRDALRLVVAKRTDRMRQYFDELPGRFGKEYVPGRSWEGLAQALLAVMPPMTIADLGAGEGAFAQLLARRAKRVVAVDSSEKMVQFGSDLAQKHGLTNLEYRLGDMESAPIGDAEVDLAFFSQSLHHSPHPDRAVGEAYRILKPGGRIAVLDLLRHQFEEARELYADLWLGFTELELRRYLSQAGFGGVTLSVVHRDAEAPHFETVLAAGEKSLH